MRLKQLLTAYMEKNRVFSIPDDYLKRLEFSPFDALSSSSINKDRAVFFTNLREENEITSNQFANINNNVDGANTDTV